MRTGGRPLAYRRSFWRFSASSPGTRPRSDEPKPAPDWVAALAAEERAKLWWQRISCGLVQPRRDKAAAVKLMRKLLKKQGFAPDVLATDKLRSYGAAKAELGLSARHEQGLRKNNRAENYISRHDGASARCNASNRLDQPSASCRSTPLSKTLSMSDAI